MIFSRPLCCGIDKRRDKNFYNRTVNCTIVTTLVYLVSERAYSGTTRPIVTLFKAFTAANPEGCHAVLKLGG